MPTRRRSRLRAILALVAAALAGCGDAAPDAAPDGGGVAAEGTPDAAPFADVTAGSGLDFHHFNGASGAWYMVEILGAGAALFDYDGDGDLDAYLVQGGMLGPGKTFDDALFAPRHPLPLSDRLYRNDGADGGRLAFTDVTAASGVGELTAGGAGGYGMGVAVGDYDGDGDRDLYVTRLGANQLLENRGDGTFADATAASGSGDDRWSVPAVFFDFDRDGDLDLFVGNYVEFDFAELPICRDLTGAQDYCGPKVFPSQADRLFENRGDGSFVDVTAERGLVAGFGPALGVAAADFDGDGWLDLYVANDAQPNNLWMNRGDGSFEDRALLAGAAVDEAGRPQGSMGVDAGDFDGDGDLDLVMTHLAQETNTVYRNDGNGMFDDHSAESGLGAPSLPYTAFGTAWLDYDNDGWLDLVAVNGAVKKILRLVEAGDPFPLHEPNQLFHNRGGGRFVPVDGEAAGPFALSEVSRGAAFGDLDDDGDVDVLVTNNGGPARLLLNRVGQERRWIGLRLLTGEPPRDALGARVELRRDGQPSLHRTVRTAASFASANDPRLLFGLGDGGAVSGLRVVWPDGEVEELPAPAAGAYHTIVQGEGYVR